MSALLGVPVWELRVFLAMRFGCGARIMGRACDDAAQMQARGPNWRPPETDTDPVCGKTVTPALAKPSVFDGLVYGICSRACCEILQATPGMFAEGGSLPGQRRLEGSCG